MFNKLRTAVDRVDKLKTSGRGRRIEGWFIDSWVKPSAVSPRYEHRLSV